MPEDQPQPPEEPTNSPKAAPEKVAPSGVQVTSLLKKQSINVLRFTIGALEGIVAKLEADTPSQTPSATSAQIGTIITNLWEKARPWLPRLQAGWQGLLQKVRSLLPASLNDKLPDWGLSGAIASIPIFFLWITLSLLPGKPPEVAQVPPVTVAPVVTPSAIAVNPEVEVTPIPIAISSPTPVATTTPKVVTTPTPGIIAPAELTAPKSAQPIKLAPPPAPVLTPEQSLVATIQKQVAEVTSQYANGLIQSIQANFPSSRLQVKVTNDWYELSSEQQDKLATEMFGRAKELDFSKLEIADLEGNLLARSPVVGAKMVILQRKTTT